jgi:hypothetical protein
VGFPDKWFETAFNEFLQAWEREIGMRPKGAAKAAQPHLRDANT